MIRVGIIGCGTIGSYLALEILKRYRGKVKLTGVCDQDRQKIKHLRILAKRPVKEFSLDKLISSCDLIIEAAKAEIVPLIVKKAVTYDTDVMIMSVGGLLRHLNLLKDIRAKKIKLYIPSGAIAGLDALKAARMGKIEQVTLITTKPLKGLKGAAYLEKRKIDLEKIKTEKIVFCGSAAEAVRGFSKNINVAAVLSIAGVGAKRTRVCIVGSRLVKRNIHTIEIKGNFGTILCRTENVPAPANPKTSMLAMLSALATLDGMLSDSRFGT